MNSRTVPSFHRCKGSPLTHDWLALQKLAAQEFGARVDLITDWAAATPDTDWTVTDLVRHVVLEQ
ncbi:MAG: maleylpyruvate isomerase N-terminal domain-containing protein [Cryobacterium sp.]|nr:maleylpyruvate isomerase N-terminal domain-containing protein [Cryobacterium sp.]